MTDTGSASLSPRDTEVEVFGEDTDSNMGSDTDGYIGDFEMIAPQALTSSASPEQRCLATKTRITATPIELASGILSDSDSSDLEDWQEEDGVDDEQLIMQRDNTISQLTEELDDLKSMRAQSGSLLQHQSERISQLDAMVADLNETSTQLQRDFDEAKSSNILAQKTLEDKHRVVLAKAKADVNRLAQELQRAKVAGQNRLSAHQEASSAWEQKRKELEDAILRAQHAGACEVEHLADYYESKLASTDEEIAGLETEIEMREHLICHQEEMISTHINDIDALTAETHELTLSNEDLTSALQACKNSFEAKLAEKDNDILQLKSTENGLQSKIATLKRESEALEQATSTGLTTKDAHIRKLEKQVQWFQADIVCLKDNHLHQLNKMKAAAARDIEDMEQQCASMRSDKSAQTTKVQTEVATKTADIAHLAELNALLKVEHTQAIEDERKHTQGIIANMKIKLDKKLEDNMTSYQRASYEENEAHVTELTTCRQELAVANEMYNQLESKHQAELKASSRQHMADITKFNSASATIDSLTLEILRLAEAYDETKAELRLLKSGLPKSEEPAQIGKVETKPPAKDVWGSKMNDFKTTYGSRR